jgi:hypothetical protein
VDYHISPLTIVKFSKLNFPAIQRVEKYGHQLAAEGESVSPMIKMSKKDLG